jgi:hypothetical protein
MIETIYQDVAHFLTMMGERTDSWHLTPIRGNSKTSKLLPFTGAYFATMKAIRLNTISQIYETHLSGGIDITTSADLRANLTDNLHLFVKLSSTSIQR